MTEQRTDAAPTDHHERPTSNVPDDSDVPQTSTPSRVQAPIISGDKKPLLIFDFDGTLIDSVPDLAAATNAMLKQLDRDTYGHDTIRNWVGNGSRMLVARALSGDSEIDPALSDQHIEDAQTLFFAAYGNQDGKKTQAYTDVDAGLKQLKRDGYPLALVTNKPYRFVPTILKRLGWDKLFTIELGGDSLPVQKPDPAPLRYVCDKLGYLPNQALMIGDSKNDIVAGQAAGMATVGLSYGYNYGQDIRDFHPSQAFDCFAELMDWLHATYTPHTDHDDTDTTAAT